MPIRLSEQDEANLSYLSKTSTKRQKQIYKLTLFQLNAEEIAFVTELPQRTVQREIKTINKILSQRTETHTNI
jgi:hypothetical protein